MRVVILGGGAIGASTAYALAARGAEVVLVERGTVAGAASGRSGGFLARDWCDGTAQEALARRSFALHAVLAAELRGEPDGDWGYRRMDTFGGVIGGMGGRSWGAGRRRGGPDWVGPEVAIGGRLGSGETTAQVHPRAFTEAMMRAAVRRGAALRIGRVTGVERRGDAVTGVDVEGEGVGTDAVVVAMGPWSDEARSWLPTPPVRALKGHSMVFDTRGALPAEALFLECEEEDGSLLSPEVFPRADGTTYACAISSGVPLPEDPASVVPDPGATLRLRALCGRISPVLRDAPVLVSQACHRPMIGDGLPAIGAVPGVRGAFVATGHGVWGILHAPGTAEAVAELVLEGNAREVELAAFDPGRFAGRETGRMGRAVPAPS